MMRWKWRSRQKREELPNSDPHLGRYSARRGHRLRRATNVNCSASSAPKTTNRDRPLSDNASHRLTSDTSIYRDQVTTAECRQRDRSRVPSRATSPALHSLRDSALSGRTVLCAIERWSRSRGPLCTSLASIRSQSTPLQSWPRSSGEPRANPQLRGACRTRTRICGPHIQRFQTHRAARCTRDTLRHTSSDAAR